MQRLTLQMVPGGLAESLGEIKTNELEIGGFIASSSETRRIKHRPHGLIFLPVSFAEVHERGQSAGASYGKLLPRLFQATATDLRKRGPEWVLEPSI